MRNALVVAAAVVLVGASMLNPAPALQAQDVYAGGVRYAPASVEALAARCGPVQQVIALDSAIGTVPVTSALAYQTDVPVAGWMAPDLPRAGTATPEQGVRALWQGQRIVWLGAGASAADVAAAREAVAEHPQWNASVHRWPGDYPWQLGPEQAVATSWGTLQSCTTLAPQVIDALFADAAPAPGAPGQTPPSLTENEASA
ncbi:DUF3105 domain-containing protein [Cellulosimicrobium sp. Marseille-Q4280]|uniref:DUF3105 domain-containing protein n=1 Tax=Cellulosimicrobium sp. Marseille-Q4280 TaxID=2937992 RepID=UPI0020424AD9|nr:DUF3105 domain-containing protein [Cellulosimicrobium sp. Marseille-Q4280]